MAKISRSQQIISEIERFLDAGKYEDAKVLLSFLDYNPLNRESRLTLLRINVTLDGPIAYKDEIDEVRNLPDLSDREKEIVKKILLLASKSTDEQDRRVRSPAYPLNQLPEQTVSLQAFESELHEKAELLKARELELATIRKQLEDLSASKDQAVQSLEETLTLNAELLRTKEAAIDAIENRLGETIRFFENQLSEKQDLLESRDANLSAIESKVSQLTAQLGELGWAKDQDGNILREEINRKSELLQVKDSALKDLQQHFAEQIRTLETQLDEKRNLLKTHDSELDSLMSKISELIQERNELVSEREKSTRWSQEELRGKEALLHAMKSAIADLEEQMRKKVQFFERQLAEKQRLVESNDAELTDLRHHTHILQERLTEVERARFRAETALYESSKSATEAQSAGESAHESFARESSENGPPVPVPKSTWAIADQDSKWNWPSRLLKARQITWKPKVVSDLLPMAAAGLLIISIAYLLPGDGPTPPRYTTATPTPTMDAIADEKHRAPVNPRLLDLKASKLADPDIRSARKRIDRAGQANAYKTRRVVSLREEPRYAATAKSQIGAGTSISVLDARGDWVKVQARPSGEIGYVRREYLVHQMSAR